MEEGEVVLRVQSLVWKSGVALQPAGRWGDMPLKYGTLEPFL
jgi:hypothetical protein